jgi:hypothetical protein
MKVQDLSTLRRVKAPPKPVEEPLPEIVQEPVVEEELVIDEIL